MSESAAGKITGNMLFFQQPEILNKEQHGHLGLKSPERPFEFCSKVRALPLTVSEMVLAAKTYPIVFIQAEIFYPIAIVGMVDDVNLFVDERGMWEGDVYVPGYVRRYPFAFANDPDRNRFALVFDRKYEAIVENDGDMFFENGEPSAPMQNVIEFSKKFEGERMQTVEAMKTLESFGLIAGQAAQFSPVDGGEQQTFAQYFGIEVANLDGLSDERFLELRKTGLLPYIYAQLTSISNWRGIFDRRARRFNLSTDEILKPISQS